MPQFEAFAHASASGHRGVLPNKALPRQDQIHLHCFVCSWGFFVTLFSVHNVNLRTAQASVETNSPRSRPPVIKKYLHGTPHCYPTADCQAFTQDGVESTGRKFLNGIRSQKAQRKKGKPDQKTGTPLAQEPMKSPSRKSGLVIKIIVYGLVDQGIGIGFGRKLFYVNSDMDPAIGRKLQRPALNEFLGLGIEVLVKKRRWVHRIEQLGEVMQMKFDPMNRCSRGLHGNKGFHLKPRGILSINALQCPLI